MLRTYSFYFSSLLIFVGSCTPKEKADDFTDLESIDKDEAFRKGVQTGTFVKLSAGYTYYEYENTSADTLVVLVHGFSVPSYICDSTYYAALAREYGALRYDVYGRGYSENPDVVYDYALYVSQLRELLDAAGINQKINLVGLSNGGRIISAFAAQYSDRIANLIYVDPSGFDSTSPEERLPVSTSEADVVEFKKSIRYASMAQGQMTDFYDASPFTGWDKKYEGLMKSKGFVRALLSTQRNNHSIENEHRIIAQSTVPVYFIWGEHDTVVNLAEAKPIVMERIPQHKLFVIPEAGHLPHMEKTTMFNSILFDQIISGIKE